MTIDLTKTDPRAYLAEIERALVQSGMTAAASLLHTAHPRDLTEVFVLLPEDVSIKLWEVSDGT